MSKRNKIRYQSKPKDRPVITLTGKVWLEYVDEEDATSGAVKGDVLLYPENTALNSTALGAYDKTGFVGYFKVNVADGKGWRPVLLTEIFARREHHFSKKERPIDTANVCAHILEALKGRTLERTYREHYELGE